jgi:hypothetical protein
MKVYSKFYDLHKKVLPNYLVSHFNEQQRSSIFVFNDIKIFLSIKKDKSTVSRNTVTGISILSFITGLQPMVVNSQKNVDKIIFASTSIKKISEALDILLYILNPRLRKQSMSITVSKTTKNIDIRFSDLSHLNNWYLVDMEVGSFEEFTTSTILATKPFSIKIFNFTHFFFNI